MGRSWQDQLKTYLNQQKSKQKAIARENKKQEKQKVYGRKKKSPAQATTSESPTGSSQSPESGGLDEEVTFADIMAREGVEKACFHKHNHPKTSPPQALNTENEKAPVVGRAGEKPKDTEQQSKKQPPQPIIRKFEQPSHVQDKKAVPKTKESSTRVVKKTQLNNVPAERKYSSCRRKEETKTQQTCGGQTNPKKKAANKQEGKPTPVPPEYTVEITGPVVPKNELIQGPRQNVLLSVPVTNDLQVNGGKQDDEREVNIGLDFGTSSVKIVIGDPVLKKAFTVPFYEGYGLEQYLLPSRVWQNEVGYSLMKGGKPQRKLKLQLTEAGYNQEIFAAASAFLGLAIRHARNWLFMEYGEIYSRSTIFWKVTLGLPAENYENNGLVDRFKKLAATSWLISLSNEPAIPQEGVAKACNDVQGDSFDKLYEHPDLFAVEFDVVPELSAQIYGFLESDKFDPKATNVFMIIDVGAGTIDSSVFHVQRGRAHKLDFNFYANHVDFNGVANLNSYRVDWLREALRNVDAYRNVEEDLDRMQVPTDHMKPIPESIHDYFSGISIKFRSEKLLPDMKFFKKRVKRQILTQTLKKAKERLGTEGYFAGMPVFVCGGGSRMSYYKAIEQYLLYHPNASWFRFVPRKLAVPDFLSVPGVKHEDFDRLSVAFGLSFVNVGKVARKEEIAPEPLVQKRRQCPWCKSYTICYCG